jgi:long-subunit fatty acid transport protein
VRSLCFLLALFSAGTARAELASLFGIGPKNQAMGGVALIEGEPNPFQVYSAPASLGFLHRIEIDFGAQYFQPNIRPYGTLNINAAGTQGDFSDAGVLPGGGSQLAFAVPLGGAHPLTLGGAIFLPFASLIRISGSPVDYPFYPLYADLSRNFFFVVGAGYEPIDGWAVGVNLRSTTKSTVSYVLRSDASVNYSASATEAKSESRLSYSVLYDNERKYPGGVPFTAGAMYRGFAGMETKIQADVSAFVPIQGVLVSDPSYTPAEFVLMGTWRAWPKWVFSGEVARVKWGSYVSPYGSGNINTYVIGDRAEAANFHDITVPRFGAEFREALRGETLKAIAYRVGYQYHPSPVPDQTADTNFVDETRHLFSAGAGATFLNPWHEGDVIDLDLFFQFNLLKNRQISKGTAQSIGAPGYLAGGNILLLGAGVSLKF